MGEESKGSVGDELWTLIVEEVAGVRDQFDAQVVGVWLMAAELSGGEREVLRPVEHERGHVESGRPMLAKQGGHDLAVGELLLHPFGGAGARGLA